MEYREAIDVLGKMNSCTPIVNEALDLAILTLNERIKSDERYKIYKKAGINYLEVDGVQKY